MEIRTYISSIQNTGAFQSIPSAGDKAAVINTKDTVSSAEAAVSIIKKPVIQKAEEAGGIKETEEVRPEPSSSVITGAESISGPSAAIVSAQLRKLERTGIQFLEKRLIPIPFLKHKKIDAEQAASVLTSGDKGKISKLRVKAGNADAVPLSDFNDIGELSAFKGMGNMPAKEKELADFIGYAGKIGLEFKTEDLKNAGEYGALNFLTTGWEMAEQTPQPVHLVRDGISIMTLKPGENRTSQELKKELEKCWEAVDHVKKMDDSKGIFKVLSKPLFDMTFLEKFSGWDSLDISSSHAFDKYIIIRKHAQSRQEFDEIVDVMKNQNNKSSRYSEFLHQHTELMMKKVFEDDASPREKSEIVRDLIRNRPHEAERHELSFVEKSFKLIQKKSRDGAEFKKNAKIHSEMMSAMNSSPKIHFKRDTNAMAPSEKAFEFITDQLKCDQDDTKAFIGLLRGSTVDEAKKRFQMFQTAVRTENMDTRIKVSHELMGTDGFEENYRIVLENLEPGENPSNLVHLMKSLRHWYKDDTLNIRKSFVEIVGLADKAGSNVGKCAEVFDVVSTDLNVGMEALRVIAKPAGNESFADRVDIFRELRRNYPANSDDFYRGSLKSFDNNALQDYSIISGGRSPNETLGDAAGRFKTIFDNMGGRKNIEEIRDSYIMVSEGMKEGGSVLSSEIVQKALLNGRNKEEVRKLLRDGLQEAAGQSERKDGKIEQDGEKVIIGGVRVDKKKFDHILQVLGK